MDGTPTFKTTKINSNDPLCSNPLQARNVLLDIILAIHLADSSIITPGLGYSGSKIFHKWDRAV